MLLNEKSRGQVFAGSNIEDNMAKDTGISFGFGAKVQSPTSSGSIGGIVNELSLDLSDLQLSKAPFKRSKLVKQLYSGFLRLDLCEPLLRGNMIVLKGDKLASGKDLVMESAMKHFLKEESSHRVVHVSLNALRSE